jgi:hypothetical protein
MVAREIIIRGPIAQALWDPISKREWHRLPPEICFYGGAGTAKSFTLCLILILLMTSPDIGGLRVLWCRKTRKSITNSSIVTWSKAMTHLGLKMPSKPQPSQRQSERFVTEAGVNELVWASLEDPYSAFSAEYDIVIYEEALQISEVVYELAGPRCLRNFAIPWQGLISLTNPGPKTGWLYRRMFVTKRMQPQKTTLRDNPAYYDLDTGRFTERGRAYYGTLDHMYTSPVMRKRMMDGDFASEEGWALDNFDEERHVIDAQWVDAPFAAPKIVIPDGHAFLPTEMRIRWTFGAHDLGFVNPGSLQAWGVTEQGYLVLIEEVYAPGKDRDFWTEHMLRMAQTYHFEAVVADHDPELHAHYNQTLREKWDNMPAARDSEPFVRKCEKGRGEKDKLKVSVVRHLLNNGPDGNPRCYFFANARRHEPDLSLVLQGKPTCLLDEIPHLVWAPLTDAAIDEKLPEEKLKDGRANHGFDAMVYAGRYVRGRDMEEDWETGKPDAYPGSFEYHEKIMRETGWNRN